MVRSLIYSARDVGLIPGQGPKIPCAVEQLSPRTTTRESLHHKRNRMPQLRPNPTKLCVCVYVCVCVCVCVKVAQAQSCPALYNPIDCTGHGILQARTLEWVASPFSRGSSQLRDQTQVSCIAGRFFTS